MSSTNAAEPEKIAELYSDITNDLSYAQTFYSSRTVRVYLNQVAQGIHNLVHKQRGDSLKKFLTVWSTSLPLEIYRSRKNIYFALGMFMLWATLGAVTTIFFPDFPKMVLGSEYVRVTYENVAKGDPLAIYHDKEPLVMFIRIAQNNISISFYMFILGIFFSIGSHIMLFSNAVMVGAFQFMFFAKGLLLTSFLGIWIHGAFEISAIVIAAAAGFTLGNGLLFPGSYSRLQSLQFSAKRGIK
ncbi:MAG: stage II sporulation protein M, partial [Fluviicola sp.]